MKKRKIFLITGAAVLCLAYAMKIPVYAGDINAAEQMIIDFYNGTFSYDGKTYVATEEAKSSVYAKLAEDGVDLTEQEARTAIRQASAQVGDGVKQGYLTEVSGQGEGAGEADSEHGTDAENGSDTKTGKDKEPGNAGTEGKSENGKNAGTEADTKDGTDAGNRTDAGNGTDARDGKSIGNGADSGRDREGSGRDTQEGNGSGEGQGELPQPFRKTDMSQLLKEAEKEGESYVQITPGEDFTITVEQYLQGKVTAVSQDGDVLFEGGLPLKNTGYKTGSFKQLTLLMAAGLFITFGAALRIMYQERNRKSDASKRRCRIMKTKMQSKAGE